MAKEKNKELTPEQQIAQLQEQNANLIERVETLETALEALEEATNEAPASSVAVNAQPKEVKKPEIPKPTKVAGKTVTFKVPAFRINGGKTTAEEAVKDKALMEQILKDYPGLVTVE